MFYMLWDVKGKLVLSKRKEQIVAFICLYRRSLREQWFWVVIDLCGI